jgi:2-polyprenyl-3-methyl-5-hydroxy-6-metoxy-1,4-benzoquinol methylase
VIDGRQVAPTIDGIRADHVNRYRWAAARLEGAATIIDAACGVGYGTALLADATGAMVLGIDNDQGAVDYATEHYFRPERTNFVIGDAASVRGDADAVVSFETIEHVEDDRALLTAFGAVSDMLLASVPNETVVPHDPARNPHHVRHYTQEQFRALLAATGWRPVRWFTQHGKTGAVVPGHDGGTLIVEAVRA